MKAYKIDLSMYEGKVREIISEAVQRKAFELGYSWPSGQNLKHSEAPFLFFCGKRAEIGFDVDLIFFKKTPNKLISAADFLALTTAKDEPTFNPFDKVLIRTGKNGVQKAWCADFYSHMSKDEPGIYICVGGAWDECIPYEGNEHLLGTTDAVR